MQFQDKDTNVMFSIDEQNNVVSMEGHWCLFDEENDEGELSEMLGNDLGNCLSDPGMRLFFQGLVDEIRHKNIRYMSYLYRCQSPQELQLYRMMVEQEDRGVIRFTSLLDSTDEITQMVSQVYPSAPFNIHICPNCLKVLVEDIWTDITDALTAHEIWKDNPFLTFTQTPCSCAQS